MGMPTKCECGAIFEWMDGYGRCRTCEISRLSAEGSVKDEEIERLRKVMKENNHALSMAWRELSQYKAAASGRRTP